MYTLDLFDYFISNPTMGNYDSTYKYSNEEAAGMLQLYNGALSQLFDDEVIKERDLLAHPDVYEIYNEHLKTKFGENAPQFGQVITVEQYRAMFGEDPLDLSYIPGAVLT